MPFGTMLIHTVDVVKPGRKISRAGDEVLDWTTAVRTANKAWVTWRRVFENQDLRDTAESEIQFFFYPAVDIANEDRIEWRGMVFDVVGPPRERYTIRGLHHLEVKGRLVNG